jgi:CubicO group peptidase (beta-lactamase class C family)/ketosteroid isomerase-like protein
MSSAFARKGPPDLTAHHPRRHGCHSFIAGVRLRGYGRPSGRRPDRSTHAFREITSQVPSSGRRFLSCLAPFSAATVAGVVVAATPAAAQMPGGRGVNVELQRSQFTEVMLKAARAQVGAWLAAWRGEGAHGLERQYSPMATLVPPGRSALEGGEAIAEWAAAVVPATADANVTITDFDASEGIAYLYGNYSLMPLRSGDPMSSGQHVTLIQREGRDWPIRAQMYVPSSETRAYGPVGARGASGNPESLMAPGVATAVVEHDALLAIAALRTAWASRDTAGIAAMFAGNALLHLPTRDQPARGPQIGVALSAALDTFTVLHTALVDYGGSERLSWMLARYYLQGSSGESLHGYLMVVLAGSRGRREIRSLVFTTAAPAIDGAATGGAAGGRQTTEPEARIDSIFANFDRTDSPGCALAAAHAGRRIGPFAWGMAQLEAGRPINAQTAFYAASVSKQFTGFSIALLAEEGRLSLDDEVRSYIPELPDFGAPITIRHLLHHTSGLRDYFAVLAMTGWTAGERLSQTEFIELLARQRALNFAPGTEHMYSNTGYVLLAMLVHRISGRTLREFANERIFGPLGMTRTFFRDDATMPIGDAALGYVAGTDGAWSVLVPAFDVVGDGGLYTTIEDLAIWERASATRQIGNDATWDAVETKGRLAAGGEIDYALGLSLGEYRSARIISHGGAYGGYRAYLLRFPDHDTGVVLLCNTAAVNPVQLGMQAADVLLDDRFAEPLADRAPAPPMANTPEDEAGNSTVANLADFVGTFYSSELDRYWRFDIVLGDLMLHRVAMSPQSLRVRGEDVFGSGAATFRFGRGRDGRVTHLFVDVPRARGVRFDVP